MPRHPTTRATALTFTPQPSPPPAEVTTLRTQWKWAAFSQFFFTFFHLFAMNDVSLVDIENDLVAGTNNVLPRVVQRLLYTLSYDRKVSWQIALRKQYWKRDPKANPLGAEPVKKIDDRSSSPPSDKHLDSVPDQKDENLLEISSQRGEEAETDTATKDFMEKGDSIDWRDLPMLVKLDSLHSLTEWQFHNPMRLRSLMKSDDETASWRIEPIGYDSQCNAYWLIGENRLWIQRTPPKPKKLKRKINNNNFERDKPRKSLVSTTKRRKVQEDPKPKSVANTKTTSKTGSRTRAAKEQAKIKLDAQAKELARINREANFMATQEKSRIGSTSGERIDNNTRKPTRPCGTRMSARLRGTQDTEWQTVPEDWLDGNQHNSTRSEEITKQRAHKLKTGLESDDESISDLTELSDEPEPTLDGGGAEVSTDKEIQVPTNQPFNENLELNGEGGFIEWETICVTLYDWEHIAERFEKATHYAEKALYKKLTNEIVPMVTEELREVEKKQLLQEALVHRKRSSRIAIKESEREEALAAARKRAEDAEKMSRARRLEARLQKEEADRIKRELAREQRRKGRETREASRRKTSESPEVSQAEQVNHSATPDELRPYSTKNNNESSNGPRTPLGEDWELDCEICHRRGINVDDGTPMMSCGKCAKWQHIYCHDKHNQNARLPKRDWDTVEFFCKKCLSKDSANPRETLNLPRGSIPFERTHPLPSYPLEHIARFHSVNSPPYQHLQHPYPPTPHGAISFSHYQPHENGTSTSKHPHPSHNPYLPHAQANAYVQPPIPGNYNYFPSNLARRSIGQPSSRPQVGSLIHHTDKVNNNHPSLQPVWNISTPTVASPNGYNPTHNPRHEPPMKTTYNPMFDNRVGPRFNESQNQTSIYSYPEIHHSK